MNSFLSFWIITTMVSYFGIRFVLKNLNKCNRDDFPDGSFIMVFVPILNILLFICGICVFMCEKGFSPKKINKLFFGLKDE